MILLGLGSNMGDREKYILAAVDKLAAHERIAVMQSSSIYETEPFGRKEQRSYLNAVIRIVTDLSPEELLDACLFIEKQLGRKRVLHWGPRSIDIDLLVYDTIVRSTEDLKLPHPYLTLRKFVLVPMLDITNESIINGLTVQQLLKVCPDDGEVNFYGKITI